MKKVEIIHETLEYSINEAYKTLRTNLEFCGDDIKVIMFTSCTPNEGKSTVSMELCKTLADGGKKVLFVDADLRKSVLVARYSIGKVKGLSHYLTGQAKMEEIIYETDITGLHVVFAGPVTPNPTELLGNRYFEKLIAGAKNDYDYIIVDAPPLGSVIDAAIIAKQCDGTMFLISNDTISYRFAQNVKKQIEKTGCKILGVVLNKVDIESSGYYNGYYNGYYKKYYGKYYGNAE